MSKYERLARLLKIITLVRANPRLGRADLVRLCEVHSVRTIQRDINTIAFAGVPIYWSGEGYKIMPDFFLPPLSLSIEEALSLMLSARAYNDGEGGVHKTYIESAISKITAALPKATRKLLEVGLDKISVESGGVPCIDGAISRLYQAIVNMKQLRIDYYSHNRNMVSELVIDPYALAFRKHVWHLVAFCHSRNDMLVLRTDRIKTLNYTGKTFSYPSDLSLEKHMPRI